eukprot:CAMPEP_0117539030 /NCGR_PEP_ID=MMETSP0784-20121206/42779_1 /TAXON_ID=39447 /ORGANISM="" /LENGTH=81 /DNA_ID=CAMNT_0005335653 /DNA_START=195 /DNA_END=440 /DNA_ORIENTATION=+
MPFVDPISPIVRYPKHTSLGLSQRDFEPHLCEGRPNAYSRIFVINGMHVNCSRNMFGVSILLMFMYFLTQHCSHTPVSTKW